MNSAFAVALMIANASAMSGTDQVAWRGTPVVAQPDWPDGVLDLVNDPLRTDGWHPWFSQWPNDVNCYAFQVTGTNDVNRLITKLAGIKATEPRVLVNDPSRTDGWHPWTGPKDADRPVTERAGIKPARPRVLLHPGREARGLGFTTVLDEGNGAAAVFSIGSQERINQWYQHLQEVEPGVRRFGVHRYQEAPKAQPPTLMLYAGNPAIELKGLKIPPSVEVSAAISPAERAKGENAAAIKAIEDFVAGHKAGPGSPPEKQSTQ